MTGADIYSNSGNLPIVFLDSGRFMHHQMTEMKDFVKRLDMNNMPHTRIIDEEEEKKRNINRMRTKESERSSVKFFVLQIGGDRCRFVFPLSVHH